MQIVTRKRLSTARFVFLLHGGFVRHALTGPVNSSSWATVMGTRYVTWPLHCSYWAIHDKQSHAEVDKESVDCIYGSVICQPTNTNWLISSGLVLVCTLLPYSNLWKYGSAFYQYSEVLFVGWTLLTPHSENARNGTSDISSWRDWKGQSSLQVTNTCYLNYLVPVKRQYLIPVLCFCKPKQYVYKMDGQSSFSFSPAQYKKILLATGLYAGSLNGDPAYSH